MDNKSMRLRLGELKKMSRNYEKDRKMDTGYESKLMAALPVINSRCRHEYWARRLADKLRIRDI